MYFYKLLKDVCLWNCFITVQVRLGIKVDLVSVNSLHTILVLLSYDKNMINQ